tara:strand:+ start:2334 stop:2816 length:483 start_codon:yes stop_codon:yes gene_type:complete
MSIEMTPLNLGRIYKLYNPNLTDCYVGSTRRMLNKRLNEHKSSIRTKNEKECFLEDIGNLKIELIEEFEFTNKEDLLYRERFWFEKMRPSLNKCFPIRNKKEYLETYYKMNKQRILRERSEVLKCVFCDKNYTKRHKRRHQRSNYCLSKQNKLQENKNIQ